MFDTVVIKLGQDTCLRHCLDAVDGSGERSRAFMALLFMFYKISIKVHQSMYGKVSNFVFLDFNGVPLQTFV
jgi:hypothetical protein